MFAHTHPGAHDEDAGHHFHWAWLVLALTALGFLLASSLEREAPRNAQVVHGD